VVALGLEQRLHLLPKDGIHNGVMLTGVYFLPVAKVTEISDIAEKLAERIPGKRSPAADVPFAGAPALGAPATAV